MCNESFKQLFRFQGSPSHDARPLTKREFFPRRIFLPRVQIAKRFLAPPLPSPSLSLIPSLSAHRSRAIRTFPERACQIRNRYVRKK